MNATIVLTIPCDITDPPNEHETELVRLALIKNMPTIIPIGPDDEFDVIVAMPELSKACIEHESDEGEGAP